ncbi:MAG: HAMP domain-containing histidine kinase [Bacteroidales bacterium]|nr:HAMP domain-containing histidine kinase [Bacteroidales bacterium]
MKNRLKYILLSLTIVLALLALWQVRRVATQVRQSEEAKVRLWASAIGQRNELAAATQQFFQEATLDEHRKMELYTDILQSFADPDLGTDMGFSLRYVNYIVDSSRTPIIITTARDSIISVPQELAGQKLEGALLEEYSQNPPFDYNLWGMRMTLYYKESEYYTRLREVLESFTQSFLSDITQNSVLVPVVIVDSTRAHVIAYGNIDSASIGHFDWSNDPIEVILPSGGLSYVYYATTPLLKELRWVPLFYLFIAAVLIIVSYFLFRTARTAEQNRIWVGLAKETAHQLGTPLSSLTGWVEYLRDKEFTPQYAAEVEKDLHRLETITRRFSKIGSIPELKEDDVREATLAAISYLQSRSPRRIHFNVTFPEGETFLAPLNGYLFQWVIENLCKNAIDAMEGEGTVTIVASQDARKIYLDISDTGRGMNREVQRRIFDSGFTTKSRGWGLGLPLARRIINQYHRGRLYLKYSIPGQGSCFRIVLRKK